MTVTFNDQNYKIWFNSVTIDQIKIKFTFCYHGNCIPKPLKENGRTFWLHLDENLKIFIDEHKENLNNLNFVCLS